MTSANAGPGLPRVTVALGAVLVAAHVAIGAWGSARGLGAWAAWVGERPAWLLVAAGARTPGSLGEAPWRLLTSALVHVDLGHLLSNLAGLAALGGVYERSVGAARWAAVFVAGAVGGGLMSAWAGVPLSAGASGGIVAWLAWVAVAGPRRDRAALAGTLGAVLASSLVFPAVSLSAHVGGALVGAGAGAVRSLFARGRGGALGDAGGDGVGPSGPPDRPA